MTEPGANCFDLKRRGAAASARAGAVHGGADCGEPALQVAGRRAAYPLDPGAGGGSGSGRSVPTL